jgi:putative tricarboxylic transport membrane protein
MNAGGRDRGVLAISVALLALAAFVLLQLAAIPADGGYSAIGPRFAPMLVGAGLVVIGLWLLAQALTGGWKLMPPPPAEPMHAPSLGWIVGGLAAQMAIIGFVGFTVASTLLFAAVARGLGSRRVVHDAIVGFVLAAAVFLFFTRVLGLNLPASPLSVL